MACLHVAGHRRQSGSITRGHVVMAMQLLERFPLRVTQIAPAKLVSVPSRWQEAIQSKRKQTGGQGFPALQEREHLRVKMQSILAQKAESERRIAEAQKVQQEEERQRAAREALEKSKAKNQEWAARQLVRSFFAVDTAV
jgi:signal transduction histidine kinase